MLTYDVHDHELNVKMEIRLRKKAQKNKVHAAAVCLFILNVLQEKLKDDDDRLGAMH